ncbi:MAG: hypothetical protein BLM47_12050 [Candidatus Reconcilbacillus cellulovorans]|mgnify:FL=1|uniref:Uncharacterized protein n=1 Tax=Candidatus Reconcilbacillus cellulovorans TaxID=1906605 RepID=A0A2A6DXV2_9BACL|nr:MAG: hypothetical protein BLM47_12050 [Candidatus Reconcilbacillus cellulovorans]
MFRLPFLFMATGMAAFAVFHAIGLAMWARWPAAPARTPDGWFYAHLFVLGWATMIATGAMYQLLRVILQKEYTNRRLGYVQYAVFVAGLAALLAGFALGDVGWIASGAAAAWCGVVLFAVNVGSALVRARRWEPVTLGAAAAVGYLVLTGALGLAMGADFAFGFWPQGHERLFRAHVWLGSVGWFGVLITAFSFKLLPMFHLSHAKTTKLEYAVFALWNAAALVGAAAFLAGSPRAGVGVALVVLTTAAVVYNVYVSVVRRHRHKRSPGAGITAAVCASRALGAVAVGACAWLWFVPERAGAETAVLAATWAYLGGWVGTNVLGYFSKILPFLWWTHKYGPRVGRERVPTMAELLPDREYAGWLAVSAAAVGVLAVLLGVGVSAAAAWAGMFWSAASLGYAFRLALVLKR